jgi:hypothetical protein
MVGAPGTTLPRPSSSSARWAWVMIQELGAIMYPMSRPTPRSAPRAEEEEGLGEIVPGARAIAGVGLRKFPL